MEEKKLDLNTIIGFVLIFAIFIWIMYQNQPSEAEVAAEKAKKEQVEKAKTPNVAESKPAVVTDTVAADSLQLSELKSTLGDFAYSATLPSAKQSETTLENKLVKLTISNKGGYITEATLKGFERFHKGSGQLVKLIDNNNASLNLKLQTKDNRTLDTKNLYFEPTLTKVGQNQVLSMKLKTGPASFLEYRYVLKPNDYMLDFDVRSQGLGKTLNTAQPIDLQWDLKAFRNEKSVAYENRYAEVVYEYEEGKDTYLGQDKDERETAADVTFAAYKQHFFTSILLTKTPFKTADFESRNLVDDDQRDTIFTKQF
ncbi:MAG TPA: membrane protein insertase YidC, partial [Flavobacterium sp.]|nr:membrane protein insertase YidC [Flavobacterium sp.]